MDILSDKIVVTRKVHKCSACLRKFDKGTKMRTQVNKIDEINTWRECPTCTILLSTYRNHFSDDYDNICYYRCVADILENDETPEDVLLHFENK